ncbi:MAG: hypothetical protein ACXABY_14210 [Candidatus Thorarchaeota archaeon]|jgi:hypothetical protein
MGIIESMRRQTAVYWPPGSEATGGVDFDQYGKPSYADPVEIDCRWENVSEELVTADGTEFICKARVYVDQAVTPGGVLFLGETGDVDDLDDPKVNDGAWEVKRYDEMPNLRNTETLRTAYL